MTTPVSPDAPGPADAGPGDPIVVGRIVGVHGLQGGLKLLSYTRPRSNLLRYREWWVRPAGVWRRVRLLEGSIQGKSLVARLDAVGSREAAEQMVGLDILMPRADLPRAKANEYYWAELIGMQVLNADGMVLGQVQNLVEAGDHDVLVIAGEREYLVPFVRDVYVLKVDRKTRQIRVDWHVDD